MHPLQHEVVAVHSTKTRQAKTSSCWSFQSYCIVGRQLYDHNPTPHFHSISAVTTTPIASPSSFTSHHRVPVHPAPPHEHPRASAYRNFKSSYRIHRKLAVFNGITTILVLFGSISGLLMQEDEGREKPVPKPVMSFHLDANTTTITINVTTTTTSSYAPAYSKSLRNFCARMCGLKDLKLSASPFPKHTKANPKLPSSKTSPIQGKLAQTTNCKTSLPKPSSSFPPPLSSSSPCAWCGRAEAGGRGKAGESQIWVTKWWENDHQDKQVSGHVCNSCARYFKSHGQFDSKKRKDSIEARSRRILGVYRQAELAVKKCNNSSFFNTSRFRHTQKHNNTNWVPMRTERTEDNITDYLHPKAKAALDWLEKLENQPVTMGILEQTKIVQRLKVLKRHVIKPISDKIKKLLDNWRRRVVYQKSPDKSANMTKDRQMMSIKSLADLSKVVLSSSEDADAVIKGGKLQPDNLDHSSGQGDEDDGESHHGKSRRQREQKRRKEKHGKRKVTLQQEMEEKLAQKRLAHGTGDANGKNPSGNNAYQQGDDIKNIPQVWDLTTSTIPSSQDRTPESQQEFEIAMDARRETLAFNSTEEGYETSDDADRDFKHIGDYVRDKVVDYLSICIENGTDPYFNISTVEQEILKPLNISRFPQQKAKQLAYRIERRVFKREGRELSSCYVAHMEELITALTHPLNYGIFLEKVRSGEMTVGTFTRLDPSRFVSQPWRDVMKIEATMARYLQDPTSLNYVDTPESYGNTQYTCGRCGQRKTKYLGQVQTRSADEGMTTYMLCICGQRFKV